MASAMVSDAHRWDKRRAESILSTGSVSVGSESIYYAASGVAEAGSAVLFLHEAGGSGATWNGQLVGLAQRARCLVPDLPGHGQSTGFGFQTIAAYRNAMIGFLDALAIRWPVVIAGVCLGAAIAVDLALHAPERVAGLVLTGLQEGGRVSPALFQQIARGEAPDAFIESMFSEAVSPRLKTEQLKRWRVACPTVRHGDLVALSRYPLMEALKRLRHRVIMVAGEKDRSISPADVAQLATAAPRGEAVMIPAAGTLSMLEQPERFNQLVGDFLAAVQPAVPVVPQVAYGSGYRRFPAR
jgi:pimeloyl-ACP methyl ester carboxylesterase